MPRVFFGRVLGNRGAGGVSPAAPDVPTLAIADNATTPTGCVATVTGGSTSATHTISYQEVGPNFQLTPPVWVAAGSRTGNGTVALTLPAGIYWFRCDATLNSQVEVSNLVYTALTDGLAAVHERCILAVEAGLVTLVAAGKIPGITNVARVYDQMELYLLGVDMPSIAVCTQLPGQPMSQPELAGTNARDDISYPVMVVILDRSSGNYVANRPGYLLAQQVVFRYFREQRLGTVNEVYVVKCKEGPTLTFQRGDYQIKGSVLKLACISREVRGTA